MADKSFNAFEMAQKQFDHVADQLNLDQATRDMLRWPLRDITSASRPDGRRIGEGVP